MSTYERLPPSLREAFGDFFLLIGLAGTIKYDMEKMALLFEVS